MTKEEKIKEAWGNYFYHFGEHATKHALENNGYCSIPNATLGLILNKHGEGWLEVDSDLKYRPKSLRGIENNNGWIKIESEDDLPDDKIDVMILTKDGDIKVTTFYRKHFLHGWENVFTSDHVIALGYKYVTHYQPIEKPKLPLY